MPPFRTHLTPALYQQFWGDSMRKQEEATKEFLEQQEAEEAARTAARDIRLAKQSRAAAAAAAVPPPEMRSMARSHHATESIKYKEQSDVNGIIPGYNGHIPRAAHQYGETHYGSLLHKPPKPAHSVPVSASPSETVQQLEIELASERQKLKSLEKFLAFKEAGNIMS